MAKYSLAALAYALLLFASPAIAQWHGGGFHGGGGHFGGGFGGFHGGHFGGFGGQRFGGGWGGGHRFFGGGYGGGYGDWGGYGGYIVSPPIIQWQCDDAWGNFLYWGRCVDGN